jgi:rhamnosyl/mannosyltransferase
LEEASVSNDKPIRVCHLGKYYPPAAGGIETHVRTLARAQAELGAHVQVACINHANERGRDVTWCRYGSTRTAVENDGGVRVTRLGRSAHVAKLDIAPDLGSFFHGLKVNPVDIIHLHTPNPTMLLAVAALRPKAPLVITHHSDIVKQRKLYYAFAPFENWVYRRADRIISNSPDYALGSDLLIRHASKVDVVPMGLDLSTFLDPNTVALDHAAYLRNRYGPALWVAVGRCVYYKGFDTALHALRQVAGKLIIIGQGPYQEHLKQMSHQLGVADRVVWLNHASDDALVGAYHAAKALWFPSNARSEAFGLVQVEAMASGCPIINTDIPYSGVSWVSPNEESGFTVPVGDAAAFAAAANRLLDDPGLRDRLGEAARVRAVESFAQTQMAATSLALYARVLGRAPAAAEPAKPQWTLLPGGKTAVQPARRPRNLVIAPEAELSLRT